MLQTSKRLKTGKPGERSCAVLCFLPLVAMHHARFIFMSSITIIIDATIIIRIILVAVVVAVVIIIVTMTILIRALVIINAIIVLYHREAVLERFGLYPLPLSYRPRAPRLAINRDIDLPADDHEEGRADLSLLDHLEGFRV